MSTISELLIKIGADSSGLKKELSDSKQEINKTFGDVSPFQTMQGALTGTTNKVEALLGTFTKFAGLAAGGFGMTALISSAVNAGESVYQLQRRLNVTTAEAVEFSRILSLTGSDADTAGTAIMRMDKTLQSGGTSAEKAQKIFAALGVSMTDQSGKMLPLNKQLEQLAEGYNKAQKAGYGQEFLMNTLGARGLSLTKTLQNYAEAKEAASKVQSNGLLDINQMHELDLEMKTINMQLGQLKTAGGAALAPIAKELLPPILSGLQQTAKFLHDNSAEIKVVTKDVVTLVATYKALQAARSIASRVGSAVDYVRQMAQETSANQAKEATLTKQQERAINQRIRNIQKQALAEERAYAKSVQSMEISEAEKSELVSKHVVQRETMAAQAAERERAIMTSMFAQINAERDASTVNAAKSYQTVAQAATAASAEIEAANTRAAASANEIIITNSRAAESEIAKADAAVAAGGTIVESNTAAKAAIAETTLSQEALTAAQITTGETAAAQAEVKVGAETAQKAAIATTTATQEALTAAEVTTGNTAVVQSTKAAGACATAAGAVRTLTSQVYALAGGWMAVAAALVLVVQLMSQRNQAARGAVIDDVITLDDGTQVTQNENGDFVKVTDYGNYVSSQTWSNMGGDETPKVDYMGGGEALSQAENASEPASYTEDSLTDEQKAEAYGKSSYAKQAEIDAKNAEIERMQSSYDEQLRNLLAQPISADSASAGGGGSDGGSSAISSAPQTVDYTIEHPIGELAASIASNNYGEGEQWMGNVTSNPRIQCDSFTANVYNQAGIANVGGVDTATGTVNDAAFKNVGAYHSVGDGYEPQAGDLVDSAHHVGIYLGDGRVRSRDSSGGVTTWNIGDWDNEFGIEGYGSIAEATGNRMTTEQVNGTSAEAAAARKAQEQAKKLYEAYKQAHQLYVGMVEGANDTQGYDYENQALKLRETLKNRQEQINKIAATPGMDAATVKKLTDELAKYREASIENLVKKWTEAYRALESQSKSSVAEATHDYERMAEAEYAATIAKLDKEREAKERSLMRDQNDWQTRNVILNWYYAEVEKAEDALRESKRAAHEKYVEYLEEEGNLVKLVMYANSQSGRSGLQKNIDINDQKKLAKEYVSLWKDAHGSMTGYIADASENLYSTMSDSMAEFVRGTRTAKSVLQDFGNSVLNMMAKIAAQRLAATWMSNIVGLFGHRSSSSAWTLSNGSQLDQNFGIGDMTNSVSFGRFAKGGIVTAPTLAMIGEGGENEAVIPLNHENLSAMGGSNHGGVIVNITNNSENKVAVQRSSYDEGLEKWVLDVVVDGAARNRNGFGSNLKTALGGNS